MYNKLTTSPDAVSDCLSGIRLLSTCLRGYFGLLNVFWQWGAGKTEILTILGEAVLVVLLTISF